MCKIIITMLTRIPGATSPAGAPESLASSAAGGPQIYIVSMYTCIHIYIYIYTHGCIVYIYIYIHIYMYV